MNINRSAVYAAAKVQYLSQDVKKKRGPHWDPHIGPSILGPNKNPEMTENRSDCNENW